MKLTFILALLLTSASSSSWQEKQPPLTSLNTFSLIAKDMEGAGESFYLSVKDKKAQKFICTTNYENALIHVDQKPIRLAANNRIHFSKKRQIFTHDKYTLIIIEGSSSKVGDENYNIKGTITLKYNSNIVWKRNVIGEGGD